MFQKDLLIVLTGRATHVPVGDDQLKHIELARHLAKTYNNKYGHIFPLPEAITGISRFTLLNCWHY